jgi:hypothetical protein
MVIITSFFVALAVLGSRSVADFRNEAAAMRRLPRREQQPPPE